MPNLILELPSVNDQERDFASYLQEICQIQTDDCRKLRTVISIYIIDKQIPFEIGCGGSHIWLHRKTQHVEGYPTLSQRWAIITD